MRYGAKKPYLTTLGGRITCSRCQATSKRTKQQCKAPAIKGKQVCRFHGGYSTGFKTPEGKARASAPHTTYGHETREFRRKRKQKLAELQLLTELVIKS
jgi:hypothetical protein